MHNSAEYGIQLFFNTYLKDKQSPTILEVGAGGGTLVKSFAPEGSKFLTLDINAGSAPDILVADDPYVFPVESKSIDVVVSTSCFEHTEMFWLTFIEIMRILKDDGVFYLNAPSSGEWHRFDVDCWRFYPDAGNALVKWAHRSGMPDVALLESFIFHWDTYWNDYIAVFIKNKNFNETYQKRLIDSLSGGSHYTNAFKYPGNEILDKDVHFEHRRVTYQET